jgi:hypothetical protein
MNLFRTRTFREIVVGQHPGQHCAKLAGALFLLAGVMTRRLRRTPQRAPKRTCEAG